MSSAGDPITLPWKLNPLMFDGDSLKLRSFRKEATTFGDCCGFGDVFEGNREVPIADGALTYTQIRSRGYTDAEIKRHRKAYQFLRSALSSEVDRVRVYIIVCKGKDYCHNPKELPSITPFYRVMLC